MEKSKKIEIFLVALILLAAGFLRLWNIDAYLDFKGDEGRDVRVVRRLIVDFDPILIGPRTSIGDMYLGPLYYYLIAPSLALSGLSPIGPAAFVGLLGMATVGLVWFVGREWFGKVAGLAAAAVYAVSPVVIENTRDSWNPNIMPFFALISIYSIWRVARHNERKWLLALGVAYAFVLQSHYLGLLLLPTIGLVWVATYSRLKTQSSKLKHFLKYSLLSSLLFAFLMSPLVIFDARHGWRNFASMKRFFGQRQTTVSAKPWNAVPNMWPLWRDNVSTRIVAGKNGNLGELVGLALLAGGLFILLADSYLSRKRRTPQFLLLSTWIIFGLVGLGVYKQAIYDHYFGFMFPAPFLLAGAILQKMWDKKYKWLVIGIVIVLALVNLQNSPLKYPGNRELARVQEVDRKIIEESAGQPFNFGLIAERNYEEGYLYFFELWGAPVREIDPQRLNETLTDQLFVVCEDPKLPDRPDPCNPINHPKAEIANFGWSKVEKEWSIAGIRLFKLVHNPQ